MSEESYPSSWTVVDHIIPGVTPEMIDWWWVNMEKGYELWCPEEHKSFRWEVKPPLGGHVGALQVVEESINYGPVMEIHIEWLDPNLGTPEQKAFWTYDHLLVAGPPKRDPAAPQFVVLSHQYEAIPGGCRMRSCMHTPPGMPRVEGWREHNIAEVSRFKDFLPVLWSLWQAVKDPAINRRSVFTYEKRGSDIVYVEKVVPRER
ncbi:MAG: hypothetical protein N3B14_00725 [Thermoleophilia bacterium]|nr:hypothetical protein [Thermoleophilia bacterium]